MILRHWNHVPSDHNVHVIVDDFGNLLVDVLTPRTWWNAYRFANGQSFEQANMRSVGCVVSEH